MSEENSKELNSTKPDGVSESSSNELPVQTKASEQGHEFKNKRQEWAFQFAEKIYWKDYNGPVFDPESDEFHSDVGEFAEWVYLAIECGDFDHDAYDNVFYVNAVSEHVLQLDCDDILERQQEREEVEDYTWVDVEELRSFLEKWNKKQTHKFWVPDETKAILIEGLIDKSEIKK